MNDFEKQNYIYNFLEKLCFIDCDKHKLFINKLFYETYHIKIIEHQAKLILKKLIEHFKKNKDINNLYKK